MNPERIEKIIVAHYPRFRSKHLRRLRIFFGDFGKARAASMKKLCSAGLSSNIAADFIEWRAYINTRNIFSQLKEHKIRIVFLEDENYPILLKETADPPEALFIRGDIPDAIHISFVGSRKYTQYGQICVNLLIPDAVKYRVATVSGLALGIDALVHRKTLELGGKTVAVLGTGIDQKSIYPRTNAWLAERILKTGGALMSEFPPGTPAKKEHFPMRNRIIAGLSVATVVIEAGQKSGSLITARLALEENREVFAVPGPITKTTSAGTNHLLKAGAIPCVNFASVLEGLALDVHERRRKEEYQLPLNLHERQLIQYLSEEKHIDELVELTDWTAGEIGSILSALELRGQVKRLESQRWKKAASLP